jgi:hypothetical protein
MRIVGYIELGVENTYSETIPEPDVASAQEFPSIVVLGVRRLDAPDE